jgi:Ca2+-binding RTX toxin-like protein
VTLTDAHDLAQLVAINNATSGAITFNDDSIALSGTYADVAAALTGTTYTGDVTLSDTTIAATSLSEIDGDTSGTVTATAATTITGTAADVITAIQSTGITTATDYNVTLSGAATVAQLTTIDGDTTGAISAAAITDTFSAINTLALNSATTLQNATGPITANGNFADNSMDMTDVGNLADLVINGEGGNDTIIGAQGNDTITGGTGNDILFGGLGTDTFVISDIETNGSDQFFSFTTSTDATNANIAQGRDTLQFSTADLKAVAGFTAAGGGAELTLSDGTKVAFVDGAASVDAVATFVYNDATGVLSFDADGTGAGAAIDVGTFYSDSGSTLITDILAADFNFIA